MDSVSGDQQGGIAEASESSMHPLARISAQFIHRVDEMRQAAKISVPAVAEHMKAELEKAAKALEKYTIKKNQNNLTLRLPEDVRERANVKAALDTIERMRDLRMVKIVQRSLFIGLFSEFDAFIGELLKTIYERQPDLLKSIRREVSLPELLQFESLDAIKKDMLEKEIDSFRRESYVEQFTLLENKFSLKTLKKFAEWPEFVEIGQRRNLMTHNDGIVSEQYTAICKREGSISGSEVKVGETLSVDPKYYLRACHVLSLVAFMLVYTLWRKIFPGEAETANHEIYQAVYDALDRKHWKLATRMGEFSLNPEIIKDASDLNVRIRHINLAIAYKQQKRQDDVLRVLESCDWSASLRDFKLAVAILKDDFSKAADLMIQIGRTGELVQQSSYHDWPLFNEFRHREEFLKSYKEIYGSDFNGTQEGEPDALIVQNPRIELPEPTNLEPVSPATIASEETSTRVETTRPES